MSEDISAKLEFGMFALEAREKGMPVPCNVPDSAKLKNLNQTTIKSYELDNNRFVTSVKIRAAWVWGPFKEEITIRE